MKKLAVKWITFMLGIIIMSLGIALVIQAGLGATPISTLPLVASYISGYSFGTITIVFNVFLMLLELLLLRKDIVWLVWVLQFPMTLLFGISVDYCMHHTAFFAGHSFWTGVAINMLGNAVLALGITLEVKSNTMTLPGEGIVLAVSLVTAKKFSTMKIANDVAQTSLAILLSFLFFSKLRGIGVGTIISAFSVGLIIKLYLFLLGRLATRFTSGSST